MKKIVLGVFEAGTPHVGGTISWSHPRSRDGDFRDIGYWMRMAQVLEAADFDFLFFAGGSFGYSSRRGELSDVLVKAGMTFSLDGAYLIPALAVDTERLNFVVTSTTGADHPLHAVRKFSTLDHVTNGRIGWNIVTGASQNTMAAMLGQSTMVPHDERYRAAQEYVDVAFSFWEGGNDDDAIVLDHEANVFADPEKIHPVAYEGEYYRSHGYHTLPPSPQRSPLLFQAGTSPVGRAFAAKNAECVFVQGSSYAKVASDIADIRRRADENGRDGSAIKVMVGVTVVVGETSEDAARLRAEFDALQSDELAAHYYAGNTGVDLLEYDLDRTLAEQLVLDDQAGQMGTSNIERFLTRPDGTAPTVREILDELKGKGTRGFAVTGDPVEVADELERMMDETDLDGIMLEAVFGIASLEDFIALVQPELRRRGRLDPPATGATFRERMLGGGAHIAPEHHAASFRRTVAD
ncbi:NtaA/DmoA family FMN-dependent monooxygenase [Rathayibacter sp. VKM Ac-2759]|uniref:NtaA/DmoA family FMN-dependent monooxygenase n=1 Tax=Rathayibacter sp. VKM Ac-2759 TaxID=2609252 RepID=UPI001315EE64|nr:NtaA/DmoA family FMN-dependent monooxygenase [Rathayibacter sp. VKM Ac-2759]QHC68069.1 NtaA/DmoA family FMN-dependent monooxygenase [Rathayibacter sp. VKM Ac-2759]